MVEPLGPPLDGVVFRNVQNQECSAETLLQKEVTRCGDERSINFGAEEKFEIRDIERQKNVTLRGQGGNQHGLVFGSSQQQRALDGEGIGHPVDLNGESRPSVRGRRPEFDDIPRDFSAAI